jgi:quaternary ammonium compound-resistance protein SugE
MIVSLYLLAIAAKTLPIGTAYAAWVGIGAVGTAILGMVLFEESRDLARLKSGAQPIAPRHMRAAGRAHR